MSDENLEIRPTTNFATTASPEEVARIQDNLGEQKQEDPSNPESPLVPRPANSYEFWPTDDPTRLGARKPHVGTRFNMKDESQMSQFSDAVAKKVQDETIPDPNNRNRQIPGVADALVVGQPRGLNDGTVLRYHPGMTDEQKGHFALTLLRPYREQTLKDLARRASEPKGGNSAFAVAGDDPDAERSRQQRNLQLDEINNHPEGAKVGLANHLADLMVGLKAGDLNQVSRVIGHNPDISGVLHEPTGAFVPNTSTMEAVTGRKFRGNKGFHPDVVAGKIGFPPNQRRPN